MTDAFRYLLRVRYAECDAQKVVFNARYGDYADAAVTEFFRAIGLGPALLDGSVDSQVVKLLLEWKASARFDNIVDIAVACPRVGTSSYALACEFRLAGAPEIVATAEIVYVLIDAATGRKRPVPDDLRARLLAGAPGVVVDHAGHLAPQPAAS